MKLPHPSESGLEFASTMYRPVQRLEMESPLKRPVKHDGTQSTCRVGSERSIFPSRPSESSTSLQMNTPSCTPQYAVGLSGSTLVQGVYNLGQSAVLLWQSSRACPVGSER